MKTRKIFTWVAIAIVAISVIGCLLKNSIVERQTITVEEVSFEIIYEPNPFAK